MKRFIVLTISFLVATVCFSQQDSNKAIQLLTDELSSYQADRAAQSRTIDDGSIRVTRSYTSGEKKLDFKIGISASMDDFNKMRGEISELIGMFQAMANDGKMKLELIAEKNLFGFLNFSSRGANAVVIANDKYLIEMSVRGGTGIEDIKEVYNALDFNLLK